MADYFSLKGRVAIVTGAGRGIGKAIAMELARAGANIAANSRTDAEIEASAREIAALGVEAISVNADVTNVAQVAAMVKKVMDKWGRIDILVNNAGGTFFIPFEQIDERGWDGMMKKNLKGVYVCCHEVGKVMKQQRRGSIISTSSIAGVGPYPDSVVYGAAKAGIISMTLSLANAWGPYGIRVNCVAPGMIATEGVYLRFADPVTAKLGEWYVKRTPLKRWGQPEEVGKVVVFLASDAASFVTGQTILVGGGLPTLEGEIPPAE